MKLCLRCNQYFEDGIELCPMDTSLLEAVGEHPLIGALINDRYVVDSVIGKGSSGIVYKATRLLMGREVAVKVLHSYLGAEVGALDRFLREARAASRLRHPHIINIWESGVTDDAQPYFVMDYLEGLTLAELIRQKGFIHAGRAMPIITQICEALGEAHRQNIIHRDIKPENIVLETNEGDNNFDDYVKVLDFGIADAPAGTPGTPKQKTAAGSPAYMSPEQCQGFELDQRSDIYSLAVVIFEMLTGFRPFASDDVMKLFYMHVSQPPPTLSSMRSDLRFPMQVELAVAKALAKNPDNRQQSIKELQKDLEDAFASADMSAPSKRERESVSVDLYSVPVVERLTDGGAGAGTTSNTGQHNFLPGPENWEELTEPEPTPDAAPAPVAAKTETPDVSAAVNRLLKSAKRASEAVKQEDVGSWARDVLNRNDAPIETPEAQSAEAPKPVKASGGQSPPADTGPEISNWAHKVLTRAQTGENPVPGNAQGIGNSQGGNAQGSGTSTAQPTAPKSPAQAPAASPMAKAPSQSAQSAAPNTMAKAPAQPASMNLKTPNAVPGRPGASTTGIPPAPIARTASGGTSATDAKQPGKLGKPVELLKAKTAAEAARKNAAEAKPMEQGSRPPLKSPVGPTPDANRTLSLKSAEPPPKSQSLQKNAFGGPPQTLDQASFGQPQMLDDSTFGQNASSMPDASMHATPMPVPGTSPSGNQRKSAPPANDFDLASEIDSLLDEALPSAFESHSGGPNAPNAISFPTADSMLPKPSQAIPNQPEARSADPAKTPPAAAQNAAARLKPSAQTSGTQMPAARSAQTSGTQMPAARSAQASGSQIPAATGGDKPMLDPNRFEQPVNKTSETLNPFAQAIDGLLDAAIMPQTKEDVRRSASKLKKMDAPGTDSELDLERFEQPINSRASFDPARFENPINKESMPTDEAPAAPAVDLSRFDQPVNKGLLSGSTAGSKIFGQSDAEKKKFDPSRFDRPINQAEESLNPFAQAVDGLLDSARIKPVSATSAELGETAAAVGKPPDAAAIEALDSTAEEDRVQDAVSRLIEAAKRSTPEPVAKPEILNKKIEAVKKKIEALKAADVAKPISSGVPPSEQQPEEAGAAPAPAPFAPGPSDSNSLSDAVNRLLEAAQRQETSTTNPVVPTPMANPFADAYSSPASPSSLSTASGASLPAVANPNPFDAGASTAMVNPFAAQQPRAPEPSSSGTFKKSLPNAPNAPIGPVPPDPNKKPVEGSAFQNYVSAPTDRMTRAAELINNAIKSSKTPEVVQDYYSGYKTDPKQIQAERSENIKKGRQRVRKNFQGPPRPPLWLLLLFALAVGGFAAWYFNFLSFLPIPQPTKQGAPLTVDGYIKQGKFEKARELLDAKKKSGPLTTAETDKLNNIYYQLGLKEGKEDNYQDAVRDLKLIPRKSDLYPAAAAKIREYKKKMSEM